MRFKKLNILVVAEKIYPDTVGGSRKLIYNYARTLVARGHNIYLLKMKNNPQHKTEEIIDGIRFYHYCVS